MTTGRGLEGWHRLEHEGRPVWVCPNVPDWFVPNRRADLLLRTISDGGTLGEAASLYGREYGLSPESAQAQAVRFLERLPVRQPEPLRRRDERLELDGLRELWLHLTNRCNLACTHCMFVSSPHASLELGKDEVARIIQEAGDLGCWLYYATGGEPLIHEGYETLCRFVAARDGRHLVTLTNALAVSRQRTLL